MKKWTIKELKSKKNVLKLKQDQEDSYGAMGMYFLH